MDMLLTVLSTFCSATLWNFWINPEENWAKLKQILHKPDLMKNQQLSAIFMDLRIKIPGIASYFLIFHDLLLVSFFTKASYFFPLLLIFIKHTSLVLHTWCWITEYATLTLTILPETETQRYWEEFAIYLHFIPSSRGFYTIGFGNKQVSSASTMQMKPLSFSSSYMPAWRITVFQILFNPQAPPQQFPHAHMFSPPPSIPLSSANYPSKKHCQVTCKWHMFIFSSLPHANVSHSK